MNSHSRRGIKPGSYLYWNNTTYVISELLEGGILRLAHDVTGEILDLSLEDILLPAKSSPCDDAQTIFASTRDELLAAIERQAPLPEPTNKHALPQTLTEQAKRIVETVEFVEGYIEEERRRAKLHGNEHSFRRTAALLRALESQVTHRIQKSQYYIYRRLYDRNAGDSNRIAASLRRISYNQTHINKNALFFVDQMIIRYYTRSKGMNKSKLYSTLEKKLIRTQNYWIDLGKRDSEVPLDLVEELLDPHIPLDTLLGNPEKAELLTEIHIPSKSWFYNYIKWFESHPDLGEGVISGRYGKDVWESEYMIFDTFVTRATTILQYVFADHYLVDVLTVQKANRTVTYRLWLTVLIDAYSRAILGYALLSESPCIESIQTALLHSIWPKTSHKEYGIEEPWVAYGIAQYLYLDNAWAHHSHSLEELAKGIGMKGQYPIITLVFRPPYKARYGAIIERLFGNLSSKIRAVLPGAIQSSAPKDIRNAKRFAHLIYEDLDRFVNKIAVEYMHTPHSGLAGMTPHEKWLEAVEDLGEPIVPPLNDRVRRYFWRLEPKTKVLASKGICAFGMHYWASELAGAERIDKRNGKKVQYSVRYDINDISQIALFREDDYMCDIDAKQLRRPDGTLRHLSLAEREMAQEIAKAKGKPASQWLDEIEEIDEVSKKRRSEQHSERAKAKSLAPSLSTTQAAQEALMHRSQEGDAYDGYDDLLRGFTSKSG